MTPYMSDTYLAHIVSGLPSWLPETVLSVVVVVPGMLFGIWAARRRYLDEPRVHAVLLRRAALGLLLTALVLRSPEALVGVWVASVVVAAAMDQAGRSGPAEMLVRKLTYRRTR